MTADDVYSRYQIMPSLQLHMLRVAGVGWLLAQHCQPAVDEKEIVAACLLHDMGNIIKFDLERFPDFVQPEGKAHWQAIKETFAKKYGPNSHQATIHICRELGVGARVIELIDAISFNQEKHNFESSDFSKKICAYADMRVGPHGVTSMEERLEDAKTRYYRSGKDDSFHYAMRAYLRKIEQQLAQVVTLKLDDISEASVSPLFSRLRQWQII